jgi:FKBP-type peptidyl-prolyl cis-trans isomerase FklB
MLTAIKKLFTGLWAFVAGIVGGIGGWLLDRNSIAHAECELERAQRKQEADKLAKDEKLYGPNRRAGEEFLKENATKDSVITTASGLQYKVLVQGNGQVPQVTDKVKVNYEGRLIDGTVFDASSKHGSEPAEFLPNQVIAGWTEALTMMPVGSKWQLYIPQQLAYGERNMGNIKPYSTLIFDVELVDIVGAKKEELAKEEPAAKNKKTKKGKK